MTQGIFNYQVPGRTPATNASNTNNANAPVNAVKQYQDSSSNNTEQLSNIQLLIMNLLQSLLQKLGLGTGETTPPPTTSPKPDITTLAIGEEDGGTATTQAVGEEDGGVKPPTDVTTLAVGEEDGGIATTQAVGEEDGGIKPPIDVTTLAVGEEDGGVKPPIDVTTLAVGEEDGGGITTKALGEDGGCFPKKHYQLD